MPALLTALACVLALLPPAAGAAEPAASAAEPAVGAAAAAPEVVRRSGPDRFATAAAISAATFAPGVATAYVATGEAFPDALAGGALAAQSDAPVLLVWRGAVPEATAAELRRLQPGRIVIFGGTQAVSEDVAAALQELTAGTVTRLSGASRYGTAEAIAAAGFEPGVPVALVATGEGFADALSGSAAAAHQDAPILLVRPGEVPEETARELERLRPARIDVLGGTVAVADATLAALGPYAPEVRRLSGPDRYATAAAISADAFAESTTVFLATGGTFADALAGAPAAAQAEAPVLLTQQECVPGVVGDEIARLGPAQLVVLGGTVAVSEEAALLTPCEAPTEPPPPPGEDPPPPPAEELPPPTFTVDAAVQPDQPGLAPRADGQPRPLARVVDEHGNVMDFVQDELVLVTDDDAALQAFLERWAGIVLDQAELEGEPTTYLVRIDPTRADPGELVADVRALDPLSRGAHRVSSETGLQLLAAAADSAAAGATVGTSFVVRGEHHGRFVDGISQEAPTGPGGYSTNALDWTYMSNGSTQDFGVGEAWRLLEAGDRLGERIGIMIIDGGFAASDIDYPHPFAGDGQANEVNCSGGNACPWHGTGVALTAGGSADNGWGAAGSAAPVAELAYHVNDGGAFDLINGVVRATANDLEVVNISSSGDFPAGLGWVASPLSVATLVARGFGTLVFASAGNDGRDVDAEDCFFACWEEALRVPCESAGVVCVGGLAADSLDRAPNSAYGYADCGNPRCDVELFGPFTVYTGTDPANTANRARSVSGTSYSSPFVAGIAALVWAADPSLSDDDVEAVLIDTANGSPDTRVSRVVDAEAAVRSVLGPIPPITDIVSPAEDLTVQYGSQSVTLDAVSFDDTDGCCQHLWESSVDGPLSNSRTSTHTFASPGDHIVSVTATDAGGATASDAVLVRAVNAPPTAEIVQPAAGATLYRNVTYKLRGAGQDPNQTFVPCGQLTWTSSVAADTGFGTSACQPDVVFPTNGPRTVTLTVTDEQGEAVAVSVDVTVEDPPDAQPPIVTITSPDDDATPNPNEALTLDGAVAQAPNGGPVTYEWRTRRVDNGEEKVLGTTIPLEWVPADDYPDQGCGTSYTLELILEATDAWGTGSSTVDITLYYGFC